MWYISRTLRYISIYCGFILLGLVLYGRLSVVFRDYKHNEKNYVEHNNTIYHYSLFSCLNGVMILHHPKSKLVDINTNMTLQCKVNRMPDSQFVGELYGKKSR